MPASLVFDVLPFLRAFARFAPAVMAVAVVPRGRRALGAHPTAQRVARMSIIVAVLMVTAIELPPPSRSLAPSRPP